MPGDLSGTTRFGRVGGTGRDSPPRLVRGGSWRRDRSALERITELRQDRIALRCVGIPCAARTGPPGHSRWSRLRKTVTALHLVLELLDQRKRNNIDPRPVPVRVDIAGWEPVSNSFGHWPSRRVSQDYAMSRRTARTFVESGRILPVLDGLDEMDGDGPHPHIARAALRQLNETAWRGRPVVLTCRTDTYVRIAHSARTPDCIRRPPSPCGRWKPRKSPNISGNKPAGRVSILDDGALSSTGSGSATAHFGMSWEHRGRSTRPLPA